MCGWKMNFSFHICLECISKEQEKTCRVEGESMHLYSCDRLDV